MNGSSRNDNPAALTAVDRVRRHLQHSSSRPGADSASVSKDLRTILGRLARVRSRGGAFAKVELGPAARDEANRLQLLGSELLVLEPGTGGERMRA